MSKSHNFYIFDHSADYIGIIPGGELGCTSRFDSFPSVEGCQTERLTGGAF